MHIYVPLEPQVTAMLRPAPSRKYSRAGSRPKRLISLPRRATYRAREKGKVYFDYLQIAEGKTISAPYVLRANPGAPVATPLEWEEVRPGLDAAAIPHRQRHATGLTALVISSARC